MTDKDLETACRELADDMRENAEVDYAIGRIEAADRWDQAANELEQVIAEHTEDTNE